MEDWKVIFIGPTFEEPDPVPLGRSTKAMQMPALIQDTLQEARENGVAGADDPEIVASITRDEETGAIGLRVTGTGLNPDQAESLWRDHIEPMTRLFPQRGGAGES